MPRRGEDAQARGSRRSAAAKRWSGRRHDTRTFSLADAFCLCLCAISLGVGLLGLCGAWLWPADLLNLFRPYVFLVCLGAFLICVAVRTSRSLVFAAGLGVLLQGGLLAQPVLRGDALPVASGHDGSRLKVITFNCLGSNPNVRSVVAWVREQRPDILVLEELPATWRPTLAGLHDILPYSADELQQVRSDTDIFSRAPITQAQAYQPAQDLRALMHATVALPFGRLQVFGLHPNTLHDQTEWDDRNAALELSGQWIGQSTTGSEPVIALGDWNTPPWSPFFDRFLKLARLRAADRLIWPPMTRILATPFGVRLGSSIDHVAGGTGVRSLGCQTGPQLGSDHAPQVCELELASTHRPPGGAPA